MFVVCFGTNNVCTSTMVPKKKIIYTKRDKSKSIMTTLRLINKGIIAEKDLTYVPPSTRTSPTIPQSTRNTLEGGHQCSNYLPSWWGWHVNQFTYLFAFGSGDCLIPVLLQGLPLGSTSGSASGFNVHERATLFDESTSWGVVPVPPNIDPTAVEGEHNIRCVEGQWKIY